MLPSALPGSATSFGKGSPFPSSQPATTVAWKPYAGPISFEETLFAPGMRSSSLERAPRRSATPSAPESQGRMDKPFWRDVDNYVRNSPIHGLDNLNTPLLMAFGDKDGAVDWGQGVQMYNAARWAGKEDVVMLVYPGENHSLAKEENQVDYHHRILEWFGHYLKGEEAKKWITEGKSFLDRQKELEAKKESKPKPSSLAPEAKKPEVKPQNKSEVKPPAEKKKKAKKPGKKEKSKDSSKTAKSK